MTKRVLEDIKLNKIFKEPTSSIEASLEKPINAPIQNVAKEVFIKFPSGTKYEFLKKKKPIQSYTQRFSQTPQIAGSGSRFNKSILYIFIFTLFVGVFYLFSTVLFSAKVTIIPKSQVFELKDDSFTSSKKNGIPFEVMIVEDTLSKDVVLTDSKEVTNKAQGEITLFNEYTKTPQNIASGSFITDESGKSYKINKSVSIPGFTLNKENKVVPGQVVAGITSFIAGEAYNGSPTSFYIASFKKSVDKYKKIYGKLKTPLKGGIAGLVYIVDDKEKELATKDVSNSEERLLRKLYALVPEGYILYPKAVSFSYEVNSEEFFKVPSVKLDVNGTLSALLLKEENLSSSVIMKVFPDISPKEKSEILKPELLGLNFSFVNKDQVINKETEGFDFKLKGNLTLNWNPDINELKDLLLWKNKEDVQSIFKTDPGISSVNVSIIPFWSRKLPDTKEKINIIIQK